jgi:hypothetical protein
MLPPCPFTDDRSDYGQVLVAGETGRTKEVVSVIRCCGTKRFEEAFENFVETTV